MKKVTVPAVKKSSGKVVSAPSKAQHHKDIPAKGQRGFKLSDGSFAGREKAAKVAKAAGQVGTLKHAGKLHSGDIRRGAK